MALPVPTVVVGEVCMSSSGTLCSHGLPLQEMKCRRGPNKGRIFLHCPKPCGLQCSTFMWVDEADGVNRVCSLTVGESVSQANSAEGAETQVSVETPEVMAEVRPGKMVLTIDSKVLAEIKVHEDTSKLECQLVKPPKAWFGGKAGQQQRFAEMPFVMKCICICICISKSICTRYARLEPASGGSTRSRRTLSSPSPSSTATLSTPANAWGRT